MNSSKYIENKNKIYPILYYEHNPFFLFEPCTYTVPTCNCENIGRKQNIRYIEITIDHNSSFYPHIQNLAYKIRKLNFIKLHFLNNLNAREAQNCNVT